MSGQGLKDPPSDAPPDPAEPPKKTSRTQVLLRRKTTLLVALALVLLAVAIVAGSSAIFTSSSANPENTFTSGILTQSNSKDGSAILTATKMVPGQSANGTVEITNTGDVSGDFSVDSSNLTDAPGPNGGRLSTVLTLKVEDVTNAASPVSVYDGAYNGFSRQDLGSWSAGEKHTYKFTVTFPDSGVPSSTTTGDNAYIQSSTKIDFNWTATS